MTTQEIDLVLNGDPQRTTAGNVAQLLVQFGLETPRVAVIQNGEIVPKGDFESRRLADGDTVEIITIIGGG
jgi:thiamine biosynthesis protein ThiS